MRKQDICKAGTALVLFEEVEVCYLFLEVPDGRLD